MTWKSPWPYIVFAAIAAVVFLFRDAKADADALSGVWGVVGGAIGSLGTLLATHMQRRADQEREFGRDVGSLFGQMLAELASIKETIQTWRMRSTPSTPNHSGLSPLARPGRSVGRPKTLLRP